MSKPVFAAISHRTSFPRNHPGWENIPPLPIRGDQRTSLMLLARRLALMRRGGYSIPPDLQRTDSTRFLISRYDFLRSCCPPRPLQGVNTSHPASKHRAFSHQGVNSSPPVANRGGTVPPLSSGIIDTQCVYCRIERPFARTKGFIEPLSSHPTLGPRHRRREAVSS